MAEHWAVVSARSQGQKKGFVHGDGGASNDIAELSAGYITKRSRKTGTKHVKDSGG